MPKSQLAHDNGRHGAVLERVSIVRGRRSGAQCPACGSLRQRHFEWTRSADRVGCGAKQVLQDTASAHPPVRVTRGDPSREPEEVWFEPYTEEDLRMVNDDVNSYLAEAGVRLQPRGYKWHVLVPESVRDGEELEYALREKNQYIEPAEVLRAIERSYESLVSQIPPTS
ncbi:DUF5956 family protein [Rhodococcus qingshengii]|uniref:DUF5956 family protein n=1 Tax=Rhodococcus qingshengii TaxID=334542 RepID=UPI0036DAA1EB